MKGLTAGQSTLEALVWESACSIPTRTDLRAPNQTDFL